MITTVGSGEFLSALYLRNLVLIISIGTVFLVGFGVGCTSLLEDSVDESLIMEKHAEQNPKLAVALETYFQRRTEKKVTVKFRLLRDGGTKTGLAFEKYYAWVQIFESYRLIEQGAVRIAKIDDERFQITHYLPEADIRLRPEELDVIFPGDVVDRIVARLKR